MTHQNKRLYFNDPIKAAYMAREFGVVIHGLIGDTKHPLSSDWEHVVNFRCGKMYIAKESEYIFQPKSWDRGISGNEIFTFFEDEEGTWQNHHAEYSKNSEFCPKVEIIAREIKEEKWIPFLIPEVESDK